MDPQQQEQLTPRHRTLDDAALAAVHHMVNTHPRRPHHINAHGEDADDDDDEDGNEYAALASSSVSAVTPRTGPRQPVPAITTLPTLDDSCDELSNASELGSRRPSGATCGGGYTPLQHPSMLRRPSFTASASMLSPSSALKQAARPQSPLHLHAHAMTAPSPPSPRTLPSDLRVKPPKQHNLMTPVVVDHVYTPQEARSAEERLQQLQVLQSAFHRLKVVRDPVLDALHPELREACTAFRKALLYRRKFVFTPNWGERPERDVDFAPVYRPPPEAIKLPLPGPSNHAYRMGDDGVMRVWDTTPEQPELTEENSAKYRVPTVLEYSAAFTDIMHIIHYGPCKTEAHKRLHILESRFGLHVFMNNAAETMCQKLVPHRDFYNVRKVDNHVHHSACMNQKHLLRFIKHKFKRSRRRALAKAARAQLLQEKSSLQQQQEVVSTSSTAAGAAVIIVTAPESEQKADDPQNTHTAQDSAGDDDEVVIVCDDQPMTLVQVFDSLKISAYDLNVDALDMNAGNAFQRFDRFNLKYNPLGESRLREIFLKYDNHINGKYLAEVTQQVMDDLESNKYSFVEWRLSIYGRKPEEWANLADWVVNHKLFHPNVRWMIQIPRLYRVYRSQGRLDNLQQMLDNIFEPLFAVSVDPSSSPNLHLFLQSMVGFDSVDDESIRELSFDMQSPEEFPPPREWTAAQDPPYALFSYYVYANLLALNRLREAKGLTTFAYRPHAGEAGSIEHLVVTFLLARSINHGLKLQRSPALQYLYYLTQIGMSMSPLSNNMLFCDYDKNPFPRFFKRGLNVALSTDDPLMIHVTKEPLVEEYGVAAQVWKLSPIDMCELARNSVLQSGFEHKFKAHWIGNNYWKRSVEGNDIRCTNVPNIRVQFRSELLREEIEFIADGSGLPLNFDEVVDELG